MEHEAPQRAFKGVWIPAEIYLREDLSVDEKFLLASILALGYDNVCSASNAELAAFLSISEGRVSRLLSVLRKKDLIKTVSFDGRTRRMSITL